MSNSVFENPYVLAASRAQTKAVCKFGQKVDLDPKKVRVLTLDVKALYLPGRKMVDIIEFILDWYEPFTNDAERGGYKIAIGMAMAEVRKARLSQLQELEMREPPFEIYEQEM